MSRERFVLFAANASPAPSVSPTATPSPGASPTPTPTSPSTNAAFIENRAHTTTTLDATYAGLSAMFRLLGSSVFRIGGSFFDKMFWTPGGAGRTPGQVAPSDVDALAAFLRALSGMGASGGGDNVGRAADVVTVLYGKHVPFRKSTSRLADTKGMVGTDARERAAAGWFGFGCWAAPCWFIGPERCGDDEPHQYEAWAELGASELVDRSRHAELRASGAANANRLLNAESTHAYEARRALIRTLLAFDDRDPFDGKAAEQYERSVWGRTRGDTAVIELCAIPARSMSDPQRRRLAFVDDRIETMRARLLEHRPKLVVLYGADYIEYWTRIIGERIVLGLPRFIDGTVFAIARHPVAFGVSAESWGDLGRSARVAGNPLPFDAIPISA